MNSIRNTSETSSRIYHIYPKTCLSLISAILLLIVLVLFEIGLRMLAPIAITNVGYKNTPNGQRYGWGFKPYDLVRTENPDTGKVSFDRVNNKGWRDRDRTYENAINAFRVVVLGDSETFGFIVPKRKTFTWLLEEQFKAKGRNVEIINISYSGWGTSQQLEALEKEGIKYRPDLVVINFSGNDIYDNTIHTDPGKFGARIPFFHELSAEGKLQRRDNHRFSHELSITSRKFILSKSEIIKRLWLMRLAVKNYKKRPHIISRGQIHLIQASLADKLPKRFQIALEEEINREMTLLELKRFLNGFDLKQNVRKAIIRITENRSFQRDFHGAQGLFGKPNLSHRHWLLYKKIMIKIKDVATKGGAKVALASDSGPGLLKWMRYWHRAPHDKTAKEKIALQNSRLRSLANSIGVKFIEPYLNDNRARNDPHLDEVGHRAKADNLYKFLMLFFNNEIQKR